MLKIIIPEIGQKSPLPVAIEGKVLRVIYPFPAIPAILVQLAEKPLPPVAKEGKILRLYPFHAISSNIDSAGRKAPPHSQQPKREKSETESIHFMLFPATLVQLPEKPPSSGQRGKTSETIYPFHAISNNFHSAGRKALPPPPQWQKREKF